jgi:P27 family predicted phage terminase small subunit
MRATVNPQGNARESMAPVLAAPENLALWACPAVPESLGAIGAELWVQVWGYGKDVYHPASDAMVIERYCQLNDMRAAAMEQLGTDYLVPGSQGQDRINPLITMAKDTAAEMFKLEQVLGLNPEARVRLGIASVEAENLFDIFKKKAAARKQGDEER